MSVFCIIISGEIISDSQKVLFQSVSGAFKRNLSFLKLNFSQIQYSDICLSIFVEYMLNVGTTTSPQEDFRVLANGGVEIKTVNSGSLNLFPR